MDAGTKLESRQAKRTTVLSTLGLSFIWPFFRASYFETFLLTQSISWEKAMALYVLFCVVCYIVCFASINAKADRLKPTKATKTAPLVLGYGGTIACILLVAAGDYDVIPDAVCWVAVILWALAFVNLVAIWTSLLRAMPDKQILFTMTVSFTLSFVFSAAMVLCGGEIEAILTSFGCAVSTTLWYFCPKQNDVIEDQLHFKVPDRVRMRYRLIFISLFLIIASLANGYLYSREYIGYAFSERLSFDAELTVLGIILAAATFNIRKVPKRMLAFWIVLIALFSLGLFFMISLPNRLDLIARAIITAAKVSLNYILWIDIILVMKRGSFDNIRLFATFIGAQLLSGLFGYCGVALLVKFLHVGDELMLGIVAVLFAAVVTWFIIRELSCAILIDDNQQEPAQESPEKQASRDAVSAVISTRNNLTKRETEVLGLLLQGYSNKHIARMLFLSENTIKKHIQHIFNKTGCHTKDEVIDLMHQIKQDLEES